MYFFKTYNFKTHISYTIAKLICVASLEKSSLLCTWIDYHYISLIVVGIEWELWKNESTNK